jgi:hypothetical protein
MTYQQAADLLGGTADAARVRARRLHWRRQRGNDGKALILVPAELGQQQASPRPPEQADERPPGRPPERSGGRPGGQPEQPGQGGRSEELLLVLHMLHDQVAEHRQERQQAEEREGVLRAEVGRLKDRAAEAEAAALDAWRTTAELARLLAQAKVAGAPAHALPSRRGWLGRLLG